MAHYGWALWLSVPIASTVLAAVWTWWRARAPKLASTRTGIAEHQAYLQALTRSPVVGGQLSQEPALSHEPAFAQEPVFPQEPAR